MKKLFFIAALAAIGLASCTSEEEVRIAPVEQAITFKTVAHKPTRGGINGIYIPAETHIYVTAYQRSDDGSIYTPYFLNREFINTDVTATNEPDPTGSWKSTGANWPQNGTLDMIAYASDYGTNDKVSPDASVEIDDANKRISKLVLDFTQAETGSEKKQLRGQTDVIYSNIAMGKNKTQGTRFQFNHSLSWVMVNFLMSDNGSLVTDAYKIRKIHLHNVYLTGVNTITADYTENANAPKLTSAWTTKPADLKTEVVFPAYASIEDDGIRYDKIAKMDNKGLLIVPGAQTSISFEYATRNGGTDETPSYTAWIPYTIDLTGAGDWEAGKLYTYNINISATGITFTALVSGWTTEGADSKPLGKDVVIGQ